MPRFVATIQEDALNIFIDILLFSIGLILIIKGGDMFVDSAVWIAEKSGIPKVIIGATLVSFATTLPEITVSVLATLSGSNEIAVGNSVGSVNANIGLVLSVCAIFCPFVIKRRTFFPSGFLMLLAIGTIYVFSISGRLLPLGSVILVLIFVSFMLVNVNQAKQAPQQEKGEVSGSIGGHLICFTIGVAAIVIGARLLVDRGKSLALLFGVPESIIGVTLVAIGTSLPELVTSITAAVKKQGALSVGNILGANIIDTTLIIPLCSFISGGTLTLAPQTLLVDMPASIVLGAACVLPTLFSRRLMRGQGFFMVALYIAYMFFMLRFSL